MTGICQTLRQIYNQIGYEFMILINVSGTPKKKER